MGSRSRAVKKGRKKAPPLVKREHANTSEAVTATFDLSSGEAMDNGNPRHVVAAAAAGHVLPCAAQLFHSTQYTEVEESCADIRFFALKPRTHAQLKRCGVPVKLAEILLLQAVTEAAAPVADGNEGGGGQRVHKGIVYAHIAAAEALRNLIANDDSATPNPETPNGAGGPSTILSLLTLSDNPSNGSGGAEAAASSTLDISPTSPSFSVRLAWKLRQVWELAVEARHTASPQDWLAEQSENAEANGGNEAEAEGEEEEDNDDNAKSSTNTHERGGGSAHLALLRLLEELLLLACLCVDGGELTADIFATLPDFLPGTIVALLQSSTTTAFQNVSHAAGYFNPEGAHSNHNNSSEPSAALMAAMRYGKLEETKVLAKVAVAAADLLRTTTEESEGAALLLLSGGGGGGTDGNEKGLRGEQLAFLNEAVDGAHLLTWLRHFYGVNGTAAVFTPSALSFQEKTVYFQLVQVSLHIQGALLNATAAAVAAAQQQQLLRHQPHARHGNNDSGSAHSSTMATAAANVKKVLPLLSYVVLHLLPMRVWSSTLPLLVRDESLLATAYGLAQQGNRDSSNNNNNFMLFLFSLLEERQRRRQTMTEEEEEAGGEDDAGGESLLGEDARTSAVDMCTAQLRCTQAAARVLLATVHFICEQNSNNNSSGSGKATGAGGDVDDEAAFRRNPLSPLLFEAVFTDAHGTPVNALAAFGALLKDVLWLSHSGDAGMASRAVDVMSGGPQYPNLQDPAKALSEAQLLQHREQRLLTTFTDENAEVTTMQFILLSTEVSVWRCASSLLLMLPVESLGSPDKMWRALVEHVRGKHQLIVSTASVEGNPTTTGGGGSSHYYAFDSNGNNDEPAAAAAAATVSPAVQQLLWLQLEPLSTALWTVLRKNEKVRQEGQSPSSTAGLDQRMVHPLPTDMDLFTRLFWETKAEVPVKQSCVAAVGLLATGIATVDTITAAARFALAVLQHGTSPQLQSLTQSTGQSSQQQGNKSNSDGFSVMQLGNGLVANSAAPPTQPQARRQWLAVLSAVDSVVSLRCEAANTLIDLFLDERYDATVYIPLHVHQTLARFQPPLRQYMKKRAQLAKEMRKYHKATLEDHEAEVEQWVEVEENLVGFLSYKAAHARA